MNFEFDYSAFVQGNHSSAERIRNETGELVGCYRVCSAGAAPHRELIASFVWLQLDGSWDPGPKTIVVRSRVPLGAFIIQESLVKQGQQISDRLQQQVNKALNS